jgi:RND family efflux transporter MFP subunit
MRRADVVQRLFQTAMSVVVVTILGAGCNKGQPTGREAKPIEIVATTPIGDQVIDYQDFTGRLEGFKTVDIRARVSGFVREVPFKEGDLVHEGDLLFQIDTSPYQAALNQAVANLKVAEADRNLQEKNARRAKSMIGSRSISSEDYETILATHEKARANVGAMEAARDLAQLNLDYTRVVAPLSGRISRRYVDPGNLINADNTLLTTIVSDNPLYAYFDVDERTYLELVASVKSKGASWLTQLQFPVLMSLANEANTFNHRGTVNFIDNRVTATTGTIRMRGVFDNPDGALRPGLFVRIRLPIGTPYHALLIPDEALLSDQGRKYVYVVNSENEVVYRPVKLGQEIQGLRVIKDGVSEGERVITVGMQRVKRGAHVHVTLKDPPKPPGSSLAKLLTGALPATDMETRRQAETRSKKADKKSSWQDPGAGGR